MFLTVLIPDVSASLMYVMKRNEKVTEWVMNWISFNDLQMGNAHNKINPKIWNTDKHKVKRGLHSENADVSDEELNSIPWGIVDKR